MIFEQEPAGFNPKFEVVSCFLERDGEFVLLHRPEYKDPGNVWGVPAGKVEVGESAVDAMVRELREETSIQVAPSDLEHLHEVFVRYPSYDFTYHMYRTSWNGRVKIQINDGEHTKYTWATPENALKMDLVPDQDICIKMCYQIK